MTATPSDRFDMIRLARSEGIGPINFPRFLACYGSAAAAIEAIPERMRRAGRDGPSRIPSRAEIEDEIAGTERLGGRMLVLGDADYPLLLAHIVDPPPVLSILGDVALASRRSVAIVGARHASAAGLTLAESLGRACGAAGLCVMSGLALGIDAAAHRGAIETGATVAAIGGGADSVYPAQNRDLQALIAARGCIVTEAPLGTVPTARHFPRRNRLIAGMTLGTLVIEAAERSGTLITARLALEYGRDLFAVPGSPLDARSRGGNRLLRDGAILTETAEDILAELPESLPPAFVPPWVRPEGFAEAKSAWNGAGRPGAHAVGTVRSLLSPVPVPVDAIVSRCQFSVSAVMAALSELELGGHAAFVPGGRVMARADGRNSPVTGTPQGIPEER
ncbi:DNA-processing protein DprA [Acidomonas methanolica]|uniref:DNA-processing protein DprA n=1 Tax=Acidomonas methanolica TaxID=437 RepID=UPI00211A485E|nr:DNA-processing protein DprA [Acidomonas methanolica]MCQ9156250.1 DNA-processing protein DprA [Acidomonas methanolica]